MPILLSKIMIFIARSYKLMPLFYSTCSWLHFVNNILLLLVYSYNEVAKKISHGTIPKQRELWRQISRGNLATIKPLKFLLNKKIDVSNCMKKI